MSMDFCGRNKIWWLFFAFFLFQTSVTCIYAMSSGEQETTPVTRALTTLKAKLTGLRQNLIVLKNKLVLLAQRLKTLKDKLTTLKGKSLEEKRFEFKNRSRGRVSSLLSNLGRTSLFTEHLKNQSNIVVDAAMVFEDELMRVIDSDVVLVSIGCTSSKVYDNIWQQIPPYFTDAAEQNSSKQFKIFLVDPRFLGGRERQGSLNDGFQLLKDGVPEGLFAVAQKKRFSWDINSGSHGMTKRYSWKNIEVILMPVFVEAVDIYVLEEFLKKRMQKHPNKVGIVTECSMHGKIITWLKKISQTFTAKIRQAKMKFCFMKFPTEGCLFEGDWDYSEWPASLALQGDWTFNIE